jgi:acyl-CoA synthetase (AMP-forming)/AMP-acid ligase II
MDLLSNNRNPGRGADAAVNIGQFLARRALLEPSHLGLVAGEARLTYAQLNGRANKLANAALALGLRRGDRVALLLRNSVEYYDAYFGLAKLGILLCGINWRLAAPEVAYILANSGARLLIYGQEFADTVAQAQRPAGLEHLVIAGEPDGLAQQTYAVLTSNSSDAEPEAQAGSDDPLVLMYTSGTTGRPKGAVLTHQQMFWSSATVVFTMDLRQGDVMLLPIPLYHIGGLCFITVLVHRGASGVLLPAWDAGEALRLVEAEGVNHFMGVPTMLGAMLEHPNFASTDRRSLRWLLASAAPVPPDLIRAYAASGVTLLQSFGLTETAGPATVLSGEMALAKVGSAGLPYFHTQVKVVDEVGGEVPPGELGEIWIRGPHVIAGYWQNPAANAAAFVDGWFRSGDIGRRDAEGYLYVVDRKKDMIISGGENIYPAEIENVLFAHPALAEVAVIGLPDPVWGETVCAVVVPRDAAAPPALEDLRAFCEGKLARFKLPRRLIVRRQPLPRNPTGKLLKSRLRDLLQQEQTTENPA